MAPTQQAQCDGTQPECPPRKYRRTSGFSNQKGTNYEIKMAALMYLRAQHLLRSSFFLGVNDKSAGGFDDIVLHYDKDGVRHGLCLQLKHTQNTIARECFASEGKYSLRKLFESVRKRCLNNNTLFVFFTNAPVRLTPYAVSISDTITDLLWTSGCTGNQIFGVDINDDICKTFKDEAEAQEFINKFLIFSEQLDEDQLDEIIKQEFIKLSNGISPDYKMLQTNYLKKMEEYWQMTGNTLYLTKHSKEWKSVEPILFDNSTLLPQVAFNDQTLSRLAQMLLHPNRSIIYIRCSDTNSAVRCLKMSQALQKHRNLQKYIFTSLDDLQESQNITKLWKDNWYNLMILDQGTGMCPVKLDDLGVIQTNVNKKLVIVSDGSKDMSDIFNSPVESCHQVNETLSLCQLSVSSQELVLNQTLQLQGKRVMLRDLKVEKFLHGENLTFFLNSKDFTIGHAFISPNDSYIPRRLHKKIIIKNDILTLSGVSDKFYIIGLANEDLEQMITSKRAKCLDDLFQTTQLELAATGIEDSSQQNPQFETTTESELSDLIQNITTNQDDIPFHILHCKDGVLYWRESFKDSSQLYQFIDCAEGEMEDNKTFLEKCMTSTPEEYILVCAKLKKVIVAGDPGIGKSDLLQSVSKRMKEFYPESWVVLLNLETSIKYLKEKEKGFINNESVVRMLATAIDIHELATYRTFLQEAIENGGNICFLCDGFDEICPEYAELVLQVLNFIQQETKVASLWVSSRYVAVERLENCLQTKAFSLQLFTKQETVGYLNKSLKPEEAQNISDMIQKITPDGTTPIIGSPLYLMMIRDLIPRRKFLTSHNRLNLYKLFKSFVKIRREKYLDNVVKETQSNARDICSEYFEKFHRICSVVALDVVNELSGDKKQSILKEFEKCKSTIKEGSEKMGIIDGLTINGQPHFIHRTFAEFYLALWLEENRTMNSKFIGTITFDRQQNVLREVLNHRLARKYPVHIAVLNNNLPSLQEQLKDDVEVNSKDAGGRTPLHLICLAPAKLAIKMMKLLLNCKHKVDLEIKDNFLNSTPLYYAVRAELWDGVRLLLKYKARVENSISHQQLVKAVKKKLKSDEPVFNQEFEVNWPIFSENKTVLHLAAQSGHTKCMEMLIKKGASLEVKDAQGNRPLHDALKNGEPKAALLLLLRNACVQAANKKGDTPLHIAVQEAGSQEIVEHLLQRKANVNARNHAGETPLHDAVKHGDQYIVMSLLHHGAQVKFKNKDRDTPLHIAVRTENLDQLDIVNLLVDKGTPSVAVNKDGDTPLHLAVKMNNILVVRKLLKYNASPQIEIKNRNGDTPLHVAVRQQRMGITDLLLQCGASTSAQTRYGETALHLAVWHSNLDLVRCLLVRKASTAIKNNSGETPLHDSVKRNDVSIIQLLIDHNASLTEVNKHGDTPLHIAAKHNKPKAVNLLLQLGVESNIQNNFDDSPLHFAAKKGNHEILLQLLAHKVPVNIMNKDGDTPLHNAAKHANPRAVILLLQHGAQKKAVNKDGDTPLHIAVMKQHSATALQLTEYGLSTNVQNIYGNTRLHKAVLYGNAELVSLWLLHDTSSSSIKNNNGETPLHIAVKKINFPIVQNFLHYSVTTITQDRYGNTPLHNAIQLNEIDLVNQLLLHKASTTIKNYNGETPLHEAVKGHSLDIVLSLLKYGASANDIGRDGNSPLHIAAEHCNHKIVLLLLEYGAHLDTVNDDGDTALHIAVRGYNSAVVKLLLNSGALIIQNKQGNNPLHEAVRYNHMITASYLLVHDISPSNDDKISLDEDMDSWTEIIQLLLDHKVSVTDVNYAGETPLNIAANCCHPNTVAQLIKYAANDLLHNPMLRQGADLHQALPRYDALLSKHEPD